MDDEEEDYSSHPLAEEFAKVSAELEEEDGIWASDPKMQGIQIQVDFVNMGMQINVLLGMLVHAGIIDKMEFNLQVRKSKLSMKRAIRAQHEEQTDKSRIQVVPGHMAAELKKGPPKK